MGWVKAFGVLLLTIIKGIFGTNKAAETEVEHAEKEVEINDGKTDKDRLEDLGI